MTPAQLAGLNDRCGRVEAIIRAIWKLLATQTREQADAAEKDL